MSEIWSEVLGAFRDRGRRSSCNSHSSNRGSHDKHARGNYQKLGNGVDYDSDASHKSSHHERTPKSNSQPRQKSKLDQYKYDLSNINEKHKYVCYMKRVTWDRKRGREPLYVTLYFYKITPVDPFAHASDWEMHQKFKVLKKLRHESLMRCYDWFQLNRLLVVSYEYVAGENLLDRLRNMSSQPFNEMNLQGVMKQIFSAIDFMHQRNIVHNGLWLTNFVIFRDTKVKVTEWDYAMTIKPRDDTSLHYLSFKNMCKNERPFCSFPREVLKATYPNTEKVGHRDNKNKGKEEGLQEGFGRPVDVWALGVCFYTIVTGKPPYIEDNLEWIDLDNFNLRRHNYLKWCNESLIGWPNNVWDRVSIDAKDICYEMLRWSPRERLTIKEALNHCWTVAEELKPIGGGVMLNLAENLRNYNKD